MSEYSFLSIAGCVALGTLMLPIRQWQAILLAALGWLFRLAGIAVIAAAVAVLMAGGSLPTEWLHELSWLGRTDLVVIAVVAVIGLFPFVTFLDFLRQLNNVARRSESLLAGVQSTGLVMQAWLDQGERPGAVLTPERRIELRSALDRLRGGAPNERPTVVRTTLAQLVK